MQRDGYPARRRGTAERLQRKPTKKINYPVVRGWLATEAMSRLEPTKTARQISWAVGYEGQNVLCTSEVVLGAGQIDAFSESYSGHSRYPRPKVFAEETSDESNRAYIHSDKVQLNKGSS